MLTIDTDEIIDILINNQLPYTDDITPLINRENTGGIIYLTVASLLLIEFCVTQNTDVLLALDKLHTEYLPADDDGILIAAFCDSSDEVTEILQPLYNNYIKTRHFIYVEPRGSLIYVTLSVTELNDRIHLTLLSDPRYHQINYKE